MGKTRHATEVARALLAAGPFPDWVSFGALASLDDASLVLPTVAQALLDAGETEGIFPSASLRAHLRNKRLLLVLDDFEHLLGAAPARTTRPPRSTGRAWPSTGRLGARKSIALLACRLGGISRIQADHAHAAALYEESLRLHRDLGDRLGISQDLEGIADLLPQRLRRPEADGHPEAARRGAQIGAPPEDVERARY